MNQGNVYRPVATNAPAAAGDSWENLLSSYRQKRQQSPPTPGRASPAGSTPSEPRNVSQNQNQNQNQIRKLQTIPEEGDATEVQAPGASQNLNNSAGSYWSTAEQLFEGPEVSLVQPPPEQDFDFAQHDTGDAAVCVDPMISDACRYALLERLYERLYRRPQLMVTPPKRPSAEINEFLLERKRFAVKHRVNRANDGFSSVELLSPSEPP